MKIKSWGNYPLNNSNNLNFGNEEDLKTIIDNNNQLNLIYKPDVNYYQLKNLHFKLMSTDVNYFKNNQKYKR